ncbi:MAG: glutathione S-transferase family protein [Gammaproteobacteria bacterium]|nr:glutathione S-transferase family protein [Gammaproteobacteria bacterium]
MQLYWAQGTPNGRRVDIFLAEKGIEMARVNVDLRGGENLREEFRKINPFGRVPVLQLDDGSHLSESVAICRYLENQHPDPCLFGSTPETAAQVEMWSRRAEMNFFLQVAMAFRNITGFFKDREKVSPEWGEISQETAAQALPIFDARLGESEYLAGDAFSIADITLCCAYDFAKAVKVQIPTDLPNVNRWHAALSERPSFSA